MAAQRTRRPLKFGISIVPTVESYKDGALAVEAADRAGLDIVGIQDHPYNRHFFDTWSLIATLVARTDQIAFTPDVACLPLRPPAVLAKAAATLDIISGGRIELGIGAGGIWDAIAAIGGPRRRPGEALAALSEAIDVMRLMWSEGRGLKYDGRHYRLAGVHGGPQPAHPIGIWVGALGPRMLELIGRKADGWVPSLSYAPPERLPGMQARIDDAARDAGRDPADIVRAYNLMGAIGGAEGALAGGVDLWTETLTEWALEKGIDTFIFWPPVDIVRQVEIFAAEVAPAVREAAGQAESPT